MANHKSALKRNRQNEKRRVQNARSRSAVRTAIKATRRAIEEGNQTEATELFKTAEQVIQKAASHGLYHKNNASRKVARLAHAVQNIA